MGRWRAAFAALCLVCLPSVALAADVSFSVAGPRFPTPFVTTVLGLTLTAVAVVGARACVRNPNTMMYSVLASLALTAVMVAYSDRLHGNYYQAGLQRLAELERAQQADKPK